MVEYTIAVCNYNMADTLRESLESMISQVDDRFEILVIDDGSADGSLEILESMDSEYDNFRYIVGDNDNIAEARNQSFEEARGDYILCSMDADDKYSEGIMDFVKIFHELEDQLDFDFYLKGKNINMAKKDLILKFRFRSMGYGEDKDFWRRLFKEDSIIWLDHESFCQSIGYERDSFDLRLRLERRIVNFRSGCTLRSTLMYDLRNRTVPGFLLNLVLSFIAYPIALNRGIYGKIGDFKNHEKLFREIQDSKMKISEIEEEFGIDIDKDSLENPEIFY